MALKESKPTLPCLPFDQSMGSHLNRMGRNLVRHPQRPLTAPRQKQEDGSNNSKTNFRASIWHGLIEGLAYSYIRPNDSLVHIEMGQESTMLANSVILVFE
jgi:hypothetical protein